MNKLLVFKGYKLCMQPITSDAKFISVWRKLSSIIVEGGNNQSSYTVFLFCRYWLFEPRCYMHDTGGWYIETYGRDKKGKTIPSQRHWDGFNEHSEKWLHPAMYLVALAYRSLDLEDARRRQWNMSNFLQLPLSHILRLFKRIVNGHGEKKGADMRTPWE